MTRAYDRHTVCIRIGHAMLNEYAALSKHAPLDIFGGCYGFLRRGAIRSDRQSLPIQPGGCSRSSCLLTPTLATQDHGALPRGEIEFHYNELEPLSVESFRQSGCVGEPSVPGATLLGEKA